MNNLCVIMSVYKNDNFWFLQESINSLLEQSFSDYDIYIQIDGDVPRQLEDYLVNLYKTKQIKYLGLRKVNKGLAYSLNELLEIVVNRYDYIVRMDADDICLPDRIKKQLLFMENNPDLDLSGTFIQRFSEEGDYKKNIDYPLNHEGCYKLFSTARNPFAHPSIIFRASFFKKAGFYPTYTNCHEDTMLLLNGFLCGCKGGNLGEVLLKFRIDKNFLKRRKKYKWSKLKDRLYVVYKLDYKWSCYLYPFIRFFIQCIPEALLKYSMKSKML